MIPREEPDIRVVGERATPSETSSARPSIDEVLGWDQAAVEHFSEAREGDEIAEVVDMLLARGGQEAIEMLCKFLGARGSDLDDKPMPSQLALRGLILFGPEGIEALASAFRTRRVRYKAKAFVVLLRVAEGQGLTDPFTSGRLIPDAFLERELTDGTQEAAQSLVSGIASEAALGVRGAIELMASSLRESSTAVDDGPGDDATAVIRLVSEASIRLTPSLLDEFEVLIRAEGDEAAYQDFLEKHPVFIDPLAAEVLPRQRLGLEYATDFALRRHDAGWTVVEIEKPQDRIFTNQHNFTAHFTHAFGQVIDFQQWVDDNVGYARNHMAGISVPAGVLIIGRREGMSDRDTLKLRKFSENSRRIEVLTYDDLLARGRQLYASLWHQAPRE